MVIDKSKWPPRSVELARNENGDLLWLDYYDFSGIHRPGDFFTKNYKRYQVIDSSCTEGKFGSFLVEHILRQA